MPASDICSRECYLAEDTDGRHADQEAGSRGHSKYQFMEVNLQRRVAGLKDKIPDIRKTLETVRFLKLRRVGCAGHPT